MQNTPKASVHVRPIRCSLQSAGKHEAGESRDFVHSLAPSPVRLLAEIKFLSFAAAMESMAAVSRSFRIATIARSGDHEALPPSANAVVKT